MKKWNLTNEERTNLVKMAAGQKPWNVSYYAKALDEIEQGKIGPWNWASALLGTVWLLYHKVFNVFWLIFFCSEILSSFLGDDTVYVNAIQNGYFPSEFVWGTVIFFVLWIVLLGIFGNRILFFSLRRKLAKGYANLPHYAWTESRWLWITMPLLIMCIVTGVLVLLYEVVNLKGRIGFFVAVGIFLLSLCSYLGIHLYKTVIRPVIDFFRARKIQAASEKKAE